MNRRRFCVAFGSFATTSLSGVRALVAGPRPDVQTQTAHAFGTTVRLLVRHPSEPHAQVAMNAAFREIELIESLMSLYRSESELSTLNRHGELRQAHPYFVRVLRAAVDYSKQTESAFDITVQPLWNLYRTAAAQGKLPEPRQLRAAKRSVGYQHVEIRNNLIRLTHGAQITLNGIAQGFATDCAKRVLRNYGIQDALIDIGELGGLGERLDGEPWRVGIQHPRQADAFAAMTHIKDRCLATSGDYETAFTNDFRAHHVFDPRTGVSPQELASVSVLAPTAMEADALSTALLVLGIERAMRLTGGRKDVDAMFVRKDMRVSTTRGFPGV